MVGTRFLRVVGLLLLLFFAFDLVDGSPPFNPEHTRQSSPERSGSRDTGGEHVNPDAEFCCARSLVVAPTLPSGLGPPRDEHLGSRPEAGLAGGYVPRPFHPPRSSRT
jgi:hypothetical protein